jgi:hypothetical protein
MTDYEHSGSEVDLEAIDRVRDTHVAALNAGDAGAWAALFLSAASAGKRSRTPG